MSLVVRGSTSLPTVRSDKTVRVTRTATVPRSARLGSYRLQVCVAARRIAAWACASGGYVRVAAPAPKPTTKPVPPAPPAASSPAPSGGQAAPPVVAGDGSSPPPTVTTSDREPLASFSDIWQPLNVDEGDVLGDALTICPPLAAVAPTTPAAAMATLEQVVSSAAAPGAMTALDTDPAYADARDATKAAAAAFLTGHPGAALAATLRAAQLAPSDPIRLLNLATLATDAGYPNEGLALAQDAASQSLPTSAPMGLDPHGLVALAEAQADIGLAQWDAAEAEATAAETDEPDITPEAAGVLAAVAECRDQDLSKATLLVARSEVRTQPTGDLVLGGDPTSFPFLDLSQGQAEHLMSIDIPATPQQAEANDTYYGQQVTELQTEHSQLSSEANADSTAGNAALSTEEPAARRKTLGLIHQIAYTDQISDFAAELTEATQASDDAEGLVTQATTDLYNWGNVALADCKDSSNTDTCVAADLQSQCGPGLTSLHAEWLQDMQRSYKYADAYNADVSERQSALGAFLTNGDLHDWVQTTIDANERTLAGTTYSALKQWGSLMSGWDALPGSYVPGSTCLGAPVAPESPDPASPTASDPGKCPPALKNAALSLPLADNEIEGWSVGLNVTCDTLGVQGSISAAPGLSGFATLDQNFRDGSAELVIGAKGQIGAGPVQDNFQSGIYVKVGADGTIQDIGWRVGPSAGTNGLVQYGDDGTMDISFLNGVSWGLADQ